jgi:hypothetical protein
MAHRLPWSQARGNRFDGLGGAADFSYWQCYKGQGTDQVPKGPAEYRSDGPIAQLDRVTDFYSVGCRFESCWDRQCFPSTGFGSHAKRWNKRLRRTANHGGSEGHASGFDLALRLIASRTRMKVRIVQIADLAFGVTRHLKKAGSQKPDS